MKSKQKTQQSSINTYGWQETPTTQQQTGFDDWAKTAYNTPDPNIQYTYANMRNQVNNRLDNPYGAAYTPEVASAIKYKENQGINQMQGESLREDQFNRTNAQGQALQASAGMHAPVLTQTGGSSTGTAVTNPGFGSLIGAGLNAGASLGSAALL